MKLPTEVELEEVVSAIRRCEDEAQLYGYFETLTRNDMKFWPDSCYKACTELLMEAMGNPKLPLYPYVNLQDEFERIAKIFLSRTWKGLESKKDLPITEEVTHMENETKRISKEAYLEMVKDIINNGAEYECRYPMDSFTPWQDVDIADGYKMLYDYRKKQPKTWLEENYPISKERDDNDVPYGTSEVNAIKDFYEEFMRRIWNQVKGVADSYDDLVKIAKEMGLK